MVTKTSDPHLIALGGRVAIYLYKENSKGSSRCNQNNNYFNYHDTSNAFLPNCYNGKGNINFTPKRITVIQMK